MNSPVLVLSKMTLITGSFHHLISDLRIETDTLPFVQLAGNETSVMKHLEHLDKSVILERTCDLSQLSLCMSLAGNN